MVYIDWRKLTLVFRGTALRLFPSTRAISASGKRSLRRSAIWAAFSIDRRPFLVMTVTTGWSWGSLTCKPKLAMAAAQNVDVRTLASEACRHNVWSGDVAVTTGPFTVLNFQRRWAPCGVIGSRDTRKQLKLFLVSVP